MVGMGLQILRVVVGLNINKSSYTYMIVLEYELSLEKGGSSEQEGISHFERDKSVLFYH